MKRILSVLLAIGVILCLCPYSGLADESAAAILPGERYLEFTTPGKSVFVSFTPEETGVYSFAATSDDVSAFCRLFNGKMEELAFDDESGALSNFRVVYPLTGGERYVFEVGCYSDGFTGRVPVKLEKLDRYVTFLKLLSLPEVRAVIRGCCDIPDLAGLKLEVAWSDGQVDIWDPSQGDYVREEQVVTTLHFGNGSQDTALLHCHVGGKEVTLEYSVIDDPVKKMELLAAPAFRLFYEKDGYWDRIYTPDGFEDYYRYMYSYDPAGFRLRLTMKDGTFEDVTLDGLPFGLPLRLEDLQEEEHWTLGENNRLYVCFMDHRVEIPVSVVEDPVVGFEVAEPASVEFTENAGGWFEERYGDDPETAAAYFRYNLDGLYDSLRFRVKYKDGSSRLLEYGEESDGGHVYDCTDQAADPFEVGKENRALFAFREFVAALPVRILPNPIDRIDVTAQPAKVYLIGDPECGFVYNGVYYLFPDDLTGIAFTVRYTDGTERQFTDKDLTVGKDGRYYLNGYRIDVEGIAGPRPGACSTRMTYMGKEAAVIFTVKESVVQELKLVREPDKTAYYPGCFPDLRGAQFEITLKNGATRSVTVTDGSYDLFGGILTIPVEEDLSLTVSVGYGEDQKVRYTAVCGDRDCTLDFLQETQGKRPVRVLPIKADPLEQETEFTLFFEDGESEEVTVSPLKRNDPVAGAYTFFVGGVIPVDVFCSDSVWIMQVLDIQVVLPGFEPDYVKGDTDGNGAVNSTDARLALQLSVGKVAPEDLASPQSADVDGDGKISSTDARLILQYSVGKIADWP